MFLGLLLANAGSMAATFVDDFSLGLRPECWTVLQSTPGFYSVNATDGTVRLAKGSATTPGGVQYVFVRLNLAEFGGRLREIFRRRLILQTRSLRGRA
jgi:hypothetical protein